jgi:pilus assembly protein CpaB
MPWSSRHRRLGRWLRFTAAALCLLFAAATAVSARDAPAAGPSTPIVVATHDLAPGHVLASIDLRRVRWPTGLRAARSLANPQDVVGRRLAGPMSTGEPVTADRLLGRDLTTGLPASELAVPVTVAGAQVSELVHPGDRIELLATPRTDDAAVPMSASVDIEVVASRLLLLSVAGDREAASTDLVVATDRSTALRIARAAAARVLTAVGDPP